MKKQRRGLNRYNMLQDGKKKRILYICMIHKKLTLKKKLNKKKKKKKKKNNNNILPGFEPTSMNIDDS